MQITGHIEKGVIILDDPAVFQDGTRVRIEVVVVEEQASPEKQLRGTPYRYDDPFGPALPAEDWGAVE